jgi:predicted glutamine amidotransferase
MSARMKRNWKLLDALRKASKKKRTNLLKIGKDDLLLAICEIVDNVLKGTVKLKPAEQKKLQRYKKELRLVCDRKVSKQRKKKVINQKGGFLPLILGPALAVVGSLLGEVIGKALTK